MPEAAPVVDEDDLRKLVLRLKEHSRVTPLKEECSAEIIPLRFEEDEQRLKRYSGRSANGMARPCSPRPGVNCQRGERRKGALLCHATMGIDIGKNSFHVVGLDRRGAIVVRERWTRSQVRARLANMRPCLIGMEACVGALHLSRGDARLMPAKYVKPYRKGQKNDFRDAEAIAEAVQRPTMTPTDACG